jgi:hypothetical protein
MKLVGSILAITLAASLCGCDSPDEDRSAPSPAVSQAPALLVRFKNDAANQADITRYFVQAAGKEEPVLSGTGMIPSGTSSHEMNLSPLGDVDQYTVHYAFRPLDPDVYCPRRADGCEGDQPFTRDELANGESITITIPPDSDEKK